MIFIFKAIVVIFETVALKMKIWGMAHFKTWYLYKKV